MCSKISCILFVYFTLSEFAFVSNSASEGLVSTARLCEYELFPVESSFLKVSIATLISYTNFAATPFSAFIMALAELESSFILSFEKVGCSLVKLLIIASGESPSSKCLKSFCRLNLPRSSPKAYPEAKWLSRLPKTWMPTSSFSHCDRRSIVTQAPSGSRASVRPNSRLSRPRRLSLVSDFGRRLFSQKPLRVLPPSPAPPS